MSDVPYDPTHPVYEIEVVFVPAKGEFLIRDGKVIEITETELAGCTGDHWTYTVWVPREADDD
jgi:hypothetical protein